MSDYADSFKAYLINVKKTSKNTVDAYVRDVSQFLSFLKIYGINDLKAVSRNVIDNYFLSLKKAGKSDATKTRVTASVKCFFKYLKSSGVINDNITEEIKNPRNEKKYPGVLDSKEIIQFLSQPDARDLKGSRDRAILELLYATGIRVSELIELSVYDINPQIGILNLRNGNSSRIIPIYQKAAKHLEEYINRTRPVIVDSSEQDKLFTNMSGQPLSRQGCWKIIKYYAEKAGITKDITPQTLRHSFATHLLENGAQLKDVKELLGHSDISSTQIYADLIKQKFMKSYEQFHPLAKE